jgi:hypothetical protein
LILVATNKAVVPASQGLGRGYQLGHLPLEHVSNHLTQILGSLHHLHEVVHLGP